MQNSKEYKFYEDGSLKFIDDGLDETFDRSYKYDALGRTIEGKAGIAARGTPSQSMHKLDQPYSMHYGYDAFGHLTDKTGYYYGSEDINTYSYNAANRNPLWSYDADGNITADADASYAYDAAGRIVKTGTRSYETGELSAYAADYFGGGGRLEKRTRNAAADGTGGTTNYYIRSSVLEKVISETNATGKKLKTFVAANGTTLATQELITYNNTTNESLTFNHADASGTGAQTTTASGALNGSTTWGRTGEYAPLGRNIADASPYINLTTNEPVEGGSGLTMFPTGAGYQPGQREFSIDGMVVPETTFMQWIINSGEIGGAFGLMEIANRMSVRDYSVKFYDGNMELERFFGSEGDAKNFAFRMNQTTVFKNILVNDSWRFLAIVPQTQQQAKQTGFKLGDKGVGFTESEKSKLEKAFDKINSEKCLEFIDKILQGYLQPWWEGEVKNAPFTDSSQANPFAYSAKDLISKVSLNKYSKKLTAEQMGLTESQRKEIREKDTAYLVFPGFIGVNVGDQIWLQSKAFRNYKGMFGDKVDLPASIVHELIHAFGEKNEQTVKNLNKEIQENCGWGGTVGGD